MSAWGWLQIFAAVSAIVVAMLALFEKGSSPFRVPLMLLAVDQFAWNAAAAGEELTGDPNAGWVGIIAAPLFTPFALHYVLTFVGQRQRLGLLLKATYVVFGLQALVAAIDAVSPFSLWGGFHTYALMLLVPSGPVAIIGITLVAAYLRTAHNEAERLRSKLLIGALVTVVLLMTTDLLADLEVPVPRLAELGTFAFNAVLAQLSLGLTGASKRKALAQAGVSALFVVVAYLTLFFTLKEQLGALIIATAALSFGLLALAGVIWRTMTAEREGLARFAAVGRFSAQMAHDLKNPLAAAKGAAEFLTEELRRANLTQHQEFSILVVQQLDRLTGIIERYQRLSTFELMRERIELNALVSKVLGLQSFGADPSIRLDQSLSRTPLTLDADPHMLSSALENLVKNAFEAIGPTSSQKIVTVRTEESDETVKLSVTDTGQGMSARTKEFAFSLFFTTKSTGTGLGLPFVQQIARAHGGEVMLTSHEGQGTMVELILPKRSRP